MDDHMLDILADSFRLYYGLDWATMVVGLIGTYLITQRKRLGFLLNAIACVLGLIVAGLSDQMGYIVYNAVILTMLSRAFLKWQEPEILHSRSTSPEADRLSAVMTP
jgi:uncharacterized membrane protein YeaQ/YmgE (transglycosylase-associated protein family)